MALAPVLGWCKWDSEGGAISGIGLPASNLFAPSGVGQEQWYAVHIRSRHEKMVAAQLQGHGIQTYLPLVREVHRWSDRRQVIEVPLFPGYAFIHTESSVENTLKVVQTDGVVSIVGVRPRGTPIPTQEIQAIQRLLMHDIPYVNYPFLKVGQRVRIRGGALDGIEGLLLERRGESSLVVSVEMICRSLAVRIEGFDVEVI